MNKEKKIVILTGAKGAGKGTAVDLIQKYYKVDDVKFSVSCTTRKMRPEEQNGKHYWFIPEEEFLTKKNQDLFLETNYHHGAWYGTLKSDFQQDGLIIVDVDVIGALALKKLFPHALTIFIDTPSIKDLEKRLIARNSDTPEKIQSGIDRYIQIESKHKNDFDHWVINENRYQMFADITGIIYSTFYGNILAIDGPAKCGKGAISTAVAKPIDAHVVPTGQFFRYFGYKLRDDYSERDLKNIVEKFSYSEFDELRDELGTEKSGKKASSLASDPLVRDYIKLITTIYAYSNHGKKFIVYEGRDTTTRTARYADFKFFVTVDAEIRARRAQLAATGSEDGWEFVWNELENRDRRDKSREIDPLYHDVKNGVVGVSNDKILEQTVSNILKKHVYPKLKEGTMYG